ncbi:MAG: T9SS type A sorting domain-containing protein, partial [Bacteroidetes bacterium]|nr:T9SS type A sorting domain-containing protein [Bacteroidota bacterium]
KYPALIEGLGGSYGAFGDFENPNDEWDQFLWCVQINSQPVWSYDTSYICSIILKVDEHEEKINVQVFPNPFSLFTTIKANKDLNEASLTMINIFGQVVRTQVNLFGTEIRVLRNNLPSGIYFLCLQQDKTIISKFKVIVTD